jgi:hypothetical protein
MKKLALFAPALALCAACSGGADSLQPGQWQKTIQFSSIEVPGAPEAEIAPMRAMMSQPQIVSECLTPADTANPTLKLTNLERGGPQNCQFSENSYSGGAIRVRGTCQLPRGGTMQLSMEGTYTATTMQARVSHEMHAPPNTPGPQTIRLAVNLSARHTGECTAAPAAPAAPAGGNSTG